MVIPSYKEQWKTLFSDEPTVRVVQGVEIFRSGTHNDSQGRERVWTTEELQKLVKNFEGGVPGTSHIKLGHSTQEHTDAVAKELGLTSSILNGEGDSNTGSASLGRVAKLIYREDDGILVADFEVPESIAKLITDKMFENVSSEIIEDYQGNGPALSGVALLGSQRPAVKDLAGLAAATVLDDGTKPDFIYIENLKYAQSQDTTYAVPITTEKIGADGRTNQRTVIVQHHNAPTWQKAVSAAMSAIQAAATTFGVIVARGAGDVTVRLVDDSVRRWEAGRPTIVADARANRASRQKSERESHGFTKGNREHFRSSKTKNTKRSNTGRVLDVDFRRLFSNDNDAGTLMYTNPLIKAIMVLGVWKLGSSLWDIIATHKTSNATQEMQAWAPTEEVATQMAKDSFRESNAWNVVTTAISKGIVGAFSEFGEFGSSEFGLKPLSDNVFQIMELEDVDSELIIVGSVTRDANGTRISNATRSFTREEQKRILALVPEKRGFVRKALGHVLGAGLLAGGFGLALAADGGMKGFRRGDFPKRTRRTKGFRSRQTSIGGPKVIEGEFRRIFSENLYKFHKTYKGKHIKPHRHPHGGKAAAGATAAIVGASSYMPGAGKLGGFLGGKVSRTKKARKLFKSFKKRTPLAAKLMRRRFSDCLVAYHETDKKHIHVSDKVKSAGKEVAKVAGGAAAASLGLGVGVLTKGRVDRKKAAVLAASLKKKKRFKIFSDDLYEFHRAPFKHDPHDKPLDTRYNAGKPYTKREGQYIRGQRNIGASNAEQSYRVTGIPEDFDTEAFEKSSSRDWKDKRKGLLRRKRKMYG